MPKDYFKPQSGWLNSIFFVRTTKTIKQKLNACFGLWQETRERAQNMQREQNRAHDSLAVRSAV